MQNEWKQVGDYGEGFEQAIWDRCARKVIDEPSNLCGGFHPFEEADDLDFTEVMREKGADDDVHRLAAFKSKHIRGDPTNVTPGWTCLTGYGYGVRIQIAAGKRNRYAALF